MNKWYFSSLELTPLFVSFHLVQLTPKTSIIKVELEYKDKKRRRGQCTQRQIKKADSLYSFRDAHFLRWFFIIYNFVWFSLSLTLTSNLNLFKLKKLSVKSLPFFQAKFLLKILLILFPR